MTTTTPFSQSSSWQLKLLCFWSSLCAILLITFFVSPFSKMWYSFDITVFRALNDPLRSHGVLRIFWALANHSLADWFEDLCILTFYIIALVKTEKLERSKRLAQFIFSVLWIALTILLVNRFIFRDLLHLRRASPTLTLPDAIYLSDFLSWIQVKVNSNKSFPGDHATTALMFACSYAFFVRGKLGLIALGYAIFLCLPRLAVGAHWLSDIIVGSGSIVILFLSLAFLTPLSSLCIGQIEKRIRIRWKSKS